MRGVGRLEGVGCALRSAPRALDFAHLLSENLLVASQIFASLRQRVIRRLGLLPFRVLRLWFPLLGFRVRILGLLRIHS